MAPASAPPLARSLAALALGLYVGAWIRRGSELVGAAPADLAPALAGIAASAALAGWTRPGPQGAAPARWTRWSWRVALLLAPASLVVLPQALLAGPDGRAWPWLLALLAGVGALPLLHAARPSWTRLPPSPTAPVLAAALGLALSTPLEAPIAGLLAALLGLLLPPTPARAAHRLRRPPLGLGALPAATLALGALLLVAGPLRAATDPSAASTTWLIGGLLLGAGLGRSLPSPSASAAVLGSAAIWLLAQAVLWKGVGLARLSMLDPGALPLVESLALRPLLQQAGPGEVAHLLLVLVGLLPGLGLGMALGRDRLGPLTPLALPAALLLSDATPLGGGLAVPALVGLSAPLWSLRRGVQAGGLAIGLLAAGMAWRGASTPTGEWAAGTWSLLRNPLAAVEDQEERAGAEVLLARADENGAVLLYRPAAERRGGEAERLRLRLDGLPVEGRGRLAEAEALAGHLAGALAERQGLVLLLGDASGRAASALAAHPFQRIVVATPQREVVRRLAAVDAGRKATWLDPRVLLRDRPAATLKGFGPRYDALVEIVRTPWAEAGSAAAGPPSMRASRAALGPTGLHVLVLHGLWMEPGGLAALAAAFADEWPHVQAWLPPIGADSLVLVGSRAPLPLERILARHPRAGDWREIPGQRGSLDLASLAIADGPALKAWAASQDARLPPPHRLGPTVRERPVLHLASLAPHLPPVERIWAMQPDQDRDGLAQRLDVRRGFLELLGEATGGDMEAVFRRARALQGEGDGAGLAAVEALIEPHLRDGRRALARARGEALSSKAWDEALRHAMTAQLLAPTSALPLLLLAEIDLERGRPVQAEEGFRAALEIDGQNVAALTGLARLARLRGDQGAARELLEKATQAAPRDWRTWQNLGAFRMQAGEHAVAEQALGAAIQHSEGREAAPYLALAESQLLQGRPAAAMLTLDKALALGDSAYGFYLRGRAYRDLGQPKAAEDDFRRAVLLDPELAEARAGVGLVLAERGELEQAAEAWRAVLRLRPDHPIARETLRRIEEDIAAAEARRQPR